MGVISGTEKDAETIVRVYKKIKSWLDDIGERASGYTYKQIFSIEGYVAPYICLLNDWNETTVKYSKSDFETPKIIHDRFESSISQSEMSVPAGVYDGSSCRLHHFNITTASKLKFTFQETGYFDYLKSSSKLDFPYRENKEKTYREEFGDKVEEQEGDVYPFDHLTNISGVGIFVKTRDNYIVVSEIPETNTTYPGRHTFSASGLMKWKRDIHPFSEAIDKIRLQLGIPVNENNLFLIGFGADSRQLYFQFSFLYETNLELEDVYESVHSQTNKTLHIHGVKISPCFLVNSLFEHCWEPAATSSLYNLCALFHKKVEIENEINKHLSRLNRSAMLDEWDYRASKDELLSVMSVRYDESGLKATSKKYVDEVIEFIGSDADGKSIVEIGSGVGRITARIADRANHVTCIDISKKMIMKSISSIGKRDNVKYIQMFGQEYSPQNIHDIVICSLVLIHNYSSIEYEDLVENMCNIADKVYLFEDVSVRNNKCSNATNIPNKKYIVEQFSRFGFERGSCKKYKLDVDNLVFIEFKRAYS